MQHGYTYELTEPIGENFDPTFQPELTPKEMLEMGVFGGKYMTDTRDEFPSDWFEKAKLSPEWHNPDLNYYHVNASQPLKVWREKGWIRDQDPRGWFQWYTRYYMGRRSPDDERQIKRWQAMKRHLAQLEKHCANEDELCRPIQRQVLLHWAFDPRKIGRERYGHRVNGISKEGIRNSGESFQRYKPESEDKGSSTPTEHISQTSGNHSIGRREELRRKTEGIDSEIELSHGHSLLPFQHVGVQFLYEVRNCILADVVGLGKTVQALGAATKLMNEGVADRCIVSVPSTLKEKWRRDIYEFYDKAAIVISGSQDKRRKDLADWLGKKKEFAIISSDTLKYDWNKYIRPSIKDKYGIIIDEIQDYKNPNSERNKSLRALPDDKQCTFRFGLSATYIETGLENIFGSMLLIDNRVFGRSLRAFKERYMRINPSTGKVEYYNNLENVRWKMRLHSIRRQKEQVKEQLETSLPKIEEHIVWVPMTKKQSTVYNGVLDRTVKRVKELARTQEYPGIIPEMTFLQEVSIDAGLVDGGHSSAKMDVLKKMIPPLAKNNKIVVFCHYTKFIDWLAKELDAAGVQNIAMHGEREEGKVEVRQQYIDNFQISPVINVLVTSDISKKGVDLPKANYVINVDLLWNPASMVQRVGRIDRLGQEHSVIHVINLIADSGIEKQMWRALYRRKKLAQLIMDDKQEERVSRPNFRDIKSLLKRATTGETNYKDVSSILEKNETNEDAIIHTSVGTFKLPTVDGLKDKEIELITLRALNLMLKGKLVVWVLKGLPGSGKDTVSKSIISSVPNTVMISKDEIRRDLWLKNHPGRESEWKKNCEGLDRPSERDVIAERDKRIEAALNANMNIIVNDTNFNPIHLDRIKELTKDKATIEELFIDTPVTECIRRDRARPESERVGDIVIWGMYNRYLKGQEDARANARWTEGDDDENVGRGGAEIRSAGPTDPGADSGMGEHHQNRNATGFGSEDAGSETQSVLGKVTYGSRTGWEQGASEDRERSGDGEYHNSEGERRIAAVGGLISEEPGSRRYLHPGQGPTTESNERNGSREGTAPRFDISVHLLSSGGTRNSSGSSEPRREYRFESAGTDTESLVDKLPLNLAANKIRNWRKSIAGNEDKYGWAKNSRGMWEFSWDSPCYDLQGRFVGVLKMYYADQNPKGISKEAQMVSSGKWTPQDVGWLWTIHRGRRVWLAKSTPDKSESVANGYIVNGKDGRKHFFIQL